jgi:putative ABC transport system ATP-binding protein
MIKIDNLCKSFKDTKVLENISFEINRGDFVTIMGPSGSGKSTLLYSISGMDSINSGRVLFGNDDISSLQEVELSEFRLKKMGFVFQNVQMLKNLNILDNIILPGIVAKQESAEVVRTRARKLMSQMDLKEIENRDIREVSGGQLQRASICRALINKPDILFLDEPTGSINSTATDQVLSILGNLNEEGVTIMTVTHDARVAAKGKKVIYIIDGRIAGSYVFTGEKERELELNNWLSGFVK